MAKEENISINKLLSNCQLNSNFITNLQRRGTIPSVESIAKISKYFDVPIDYLIGDDYLPANYPVSSSCFGNTLRGLRKQNDLMQQDVAEKLGIKNNTLSNWETGRTAPDFETLIKLADYFHVSVDYLLGHTNSVMAIKPTKQIISNEFRGKALDSELWVYGSYIYAGRTDKAYIQMYNGDRSLPAPIEINPCTAGRYTQGEDMNGNKIYEDDLITGASDQVMCICFGEYQAYCPADKAFMRSVGFYAEAPGYPDMPIGNTDQYATKIGNIHDNPDLWIKYEEND